MYYKTEGFKHYARNYYDLPFFSNDQTQTIIKISPRKTVKKKQNVEEFT
jgi:hypothetical protein